MLEKNVHSEIFSLDIQDVTHDKITLSLNYHHVHMSKKKKKKERNILNQNCKQEKAKHALCCGEDDAGYTFIKKSCKSQHS